MKSGYILINERYAINRYDITYDVMSCFYFRTNGSCWDNHANPWRWTGSSVCILLLQIDSKQCVKFLLYLSSNTFGFTMKCK